MDNMIVAEPHELRGRNAKSQKYALRYPSNYIDADLPLGHHEPVERREPRLVKKKRAESHEHFICIVGEDDGTWSVRSSESLRGVKKRILADVRPHIDTVFGGPEPQFDEIKDEHVPQRQTEAIQPDLIESRSSTISYPFAVKRRRAASESTAGGTQCEARFPTIGPAMDAIPSQLKLSAGRKKPRRERVMLKIRMDETEKWYEWMQNAFKAIQQIACRSIAKEWIKAIHPKKQSTHPYNGNMPRYERKSPDRTRPPYWPRDVKHKEPDHIDKGQRTLLLTYILMNTPQPEIVPDKDKRTDKYFAAKDLLAVLEQKQDEFVVPRMEMIRDVINVRYHLELYEEGGVDADATLDVVDYSESFRNGNGGKRKKDLDSSTIKTEDEAEVESNDQEDEEISCTACVTDTPEDEKPEIRAQENTLDVDTTGSFVSESIPQDEDVQAEQPTQLQHVDPYRSMTAGHHGFHPDPGQVEPNGMLLDQHSHAMQFQPHHSLTNGMAFIPDDWSIDPVSAIGLDTSFGDGMIMVQTPIPIMDQNAYEGQVVLRTRPMNEMVAAHSFHDDSHYPYVLDPDLHNNYQMAHMGGPLHNGMHHGFDDDMYPGPEYIIGPQGF